MMSHRTHSSTRALLSSAALALALAHAGAARTPLWAVEIEPPASPQSASVACTGAKTWTDGNGTWQTAANWSDGTLPGPGDDVCIPAGVVVTLSSGTHSIQSLGSDATLIVTAGSLTIAGRFDSDGAVTVSGGTLTVGGSFDSNAEVDVSGGTLSLGAASVINDTFELNSGTLTGAGDLTVIDSLGWSGGTMGGAGSTNATGGLSITGSAAKTLSGRVLNNQGAASWSDTGNITLSSGAVLNNLVGYTLDVQNDQSFVAAGSPLPTINNAGVFLKSAGSATTTASTNVRFNNTGTVEVQTGTVSLNGGGTSNGDFVATAAGTLLRFGGGTHTLDLASSVDAGRVEVTGGAVTVAGSYQVASSTTVSGGTATYQVPVTSVGALLTVSGGTANFNFIGDQALSDLHLSAGTLTGSADLTVTGPITWTAGTMSGSATTDAEGGMSLSGTVFKKLDARTLNNHGPATWSGTGIIQLATGAVLSNLAGATFEIQNIAALTNPGSSGGTINNAGIWRKTSAGTSTIANPFHNSGVVEVEAGALSFTRGGTSSGPFVAPAAAILFQGLTFTFTDTSLEAASLTVTSDSVNFNGSTTVDAAAGTWTGGIVNFPATSTILRLGNPLVVSGSTLNVHTPLPATITDLSITSGTANLDFGGTHVLQSLSQSGGTLTGGASSTSIRVTQPITWTAGTMSGSATTDAEGGMSLSGTTFKRLDARTLNNHGPATWTGTGSILLGTGAVLSNLVGATFEIQNIAALTNPGSSGGTINNAGTWRKTSAGTSTIANPFHNSGAVEALAGTLSFLRTFLQTAGGTELNGGNLSTSTTLSFDGGRLAGGGLVTGNVTSGATVSPGAPTGPGGITITGSFTQGPSGSLEVEVGGYAGGTDFDQLTVGGNAALAGMLDIALINGFLPEIGDAFRVLNYGAHGTSTFTTVNGLRITIGRAFRPVYAADNLTLFTEQVPVADLDLTITDAPDPVVVEEDVTYTVLLTNQGPDTATGVVLTNTLPASTSFVSANATDGSCEHDAGIVTCGIASLPAGESVTVTIVATTDADGAIVDSATVAAAEEDPDTANNTATEPTTVLPKSDLSITKSDSADPALVGEDLTYTLAITNAGPSIAQDVVALDLLPTTLTFVSASAGCSTVGRQVTCVAGSLAAGASTSFSILVRPTLPGTLANTASVTGTSVEPNPADNSSSQTTRVETKTDLMVTLSDSPDPVLAGQQLSYSIVVRNNGPSAASGVTVTDTLPVAVSFVSAAAGCSEVGGTVACTVGSLNNNASRTLAIVVRPGAAAVGTLSNTATVGGDDIDPDSANNSATTTTTVNPGTDLRIAGSAAPDPVLVGDALTFTIEVTNDGPSDATGVTMVDGLSTSVTFVSATSSAGACTFNPSNRLLSCAVGALAAGATETVTLIVTPGLPAVGTLLISPTVSGNEGDPLASNNTRTISATVLHKTHLSITKADLPDPVFVESPLTYDIVVTNDGPSTATGVIAVDTLPLAADFDVASFTVGALGGGCAYDSDTHSVTCAIGTLLSGRMANVTIVVIPRPEALGQITNTVTASGNEADPDPTDNTDVEVTTVHAKADLSIAMADAPDPVFVGETLQYTLDIANVGPSTATGATVIDLLPPGVSFVSATATSGSCNEAGGSVTCDLGSLARNAARQVTIVVAPSASAAGTITNTATVLGNDHDPDPGDNEATEQTVVVPLADLSIAKSASPETVLVGGALTYELSVTNHGPSPASGVTLADELPPAVDLESATPSQGGCAGTTTVTCNLGGLADGASAVVTIVVRPTAAGPLTNTATVGGSELDPEPDDNSATVTTTAIPDNQPPTVDAGGSYEVDEGGSVLLTATGDDPDGDDLAYAWDLDDDGTFETSGASVTFSAALLDGPSSHSVRVRVTDPGELTATGDGAVEVRNVAPEVGAVDAPIAPTIVDSTVQVEAPFTDAGVPDTHTAVWVWGDGDSSAGTVNEAGGAGTVTGSHVYAVSGVYTVRLTVTDDDGADDQAVFQFVVVYDPDGGFVTGGGWITSPPGAYRPDPALTGKANFGFVSKYTHGATVPSGETEFQFKTAGLNFHAHDYDWLVVAGAKAMFKGTGTVDGAGSFGFQLSAVDGQVNGGGGVDRFRIKIWNSADGGLVYDNQLQCASEADDAEPCTALGGGSIVIHTN